MNKRQIIILWIVAAALAASVAFIKLGKEQETKSATHRAAGQKLLDNFPASDVSTVEIKGTDSAVTLVKKDGKWIIPSRENFPAKTAGTNSVNELLRTVSELKVTQGMQAGPSFASRFGMDESSKDSKEHGTNVIFKDASGKELANLTVGKLIESSAEKNNPMMGSGATGRFIRNHADDSGFYSVNELFSGLSDQTKQWLAADDFLKIEKIQSISVTAPGKPDIAWKAVRNNEDSEFALEGAAAGEAIEPATATALKSLFGYSRFNDVVTKEEAEKRAIPDEQQVATIVTFDGFAYTLTFSPSKASDSSAPSNPEDSAPPAEDTYLMTVKVDAKIPAERKKDEGEKPEDAKTKDEAFATRTKELNERLEKEKALAPYTFEVSKASFEQLVKDRATLTKKPDPEAGAEQGMQGMPQGLPPGFKLPGNPVVPRSGPPTEATTPPVEVVTPAMTAPENEAPPAKEEAPEQK